MCGEQPRVKQNLDEDRGDRGEPKRPSVLQPPTKQVSIRLPVTDLELARKMAERKEMEDWAARHDGRDGRHCSRSNASDLRSLLVRDHAPWIPAGR